MITEYTEKLQRAHKHFRDKIFKLQDEQEEMGIRLRSTWGEQTEGVNMRTVEGNIHGRTIVLVEMRPDSSLGQRTFSENQDLYVISGACEISSESESVELEAGDYVRIESSVPHDIEAKDNAVLLISYQPPIL